MNRRDNVWRSEGCFLAYANVNNSSAHEDGFHDVVFTNEDPGEGPHCFDRPRLFALVQSVARHREVLGGAGRHDRRLFGEGHHQQEHSAHVPERHQEQTTVLLMAQCVWDCAEECARCLGDVAQQVPQFSCGLDGAHVCMVDIIGYIFFLRTYMMFPPQ
jgi:hypothetical protein